jgi:hypothetical protein
VGEPRLLVVGAYLMGFELTPIDGTSKLRVFISYRLPARGISRLMGRILGPAYARWCVWQMAEDARSAFAGHAAVPA